MGEFEKAGVLLVKAEAVASVIHGFDAGEDDGVERHGVALAGQHRVDLGFERLDHLVGVGAGEVAEHAHHLVERGVGTLQSKDRVLEGRLFGVAGDGPDFGARFQDALEDGRPEMLVPDVSERRNAVRAGPVGAEGIALQFGVCDRDFRQFDLDCGGGGLVGCSAAAGGGGHENERSCATLESFGHFHQASFGKGFCDCVTGTQEDFQRKRQAGAEFTCFDPNGARGIQRGRREITL